jgi:hypothetical protein
VKLYPDIHACVRNTDCGGGRSCQPTLDITVPQVVAHCEVPGGEGVDDTGTPCEADHECFALWCQDHPAVCAGVCLADDDCPLPEQRLFGCETRILDLGTDLGWVNVCTPERVACSRNQDCPGGRLCRLYAEPTSPEGYFRACEIGGPGSGRLGDPCGQDDECATGLCQAAGEDGRGHCTRFCHSDPGCVVAGQRLACRTVPVTVWPGFSPGMSVCVRP